MDAAAQANLAVKFYRYFRRAEGAPDRYSERGTDRADTGIRQHPDKVKRPFDPDLPQNRAKLGPQ